MKVYASQSNSDWLFNILSTVMQADWLILENNEVAILRTNMPNGI